MTTVKSLNKWANAHTNYGVDAVRIALGVFLFYKGVIFFGNTEYLHSLMEPIHNWGYTLLIAHYVASAHLVGGLLIAFGLLTRWSALFQLPILVSAVIFNLLGSAGAWELLSASLAMMLCIIFMFYGSGKHSADYFFKMQQ